MSAEVDTRRARERRHLRVRKRVFGTPERPRLNVYRSLSHIYAQVIDDTRGVTLVSASTLDPEVRPHVQGLPKTEQARLVGKKVAERAVEGGVAPWPLMTRPGEGAGRSQPRGRAGFLGEGRLEGRQADLWRRQTTHGYERIRSRLV